MKNGQKKSSPIQISKKYKPKVFARIAKCSVSTLQRWDREGLLIAGRDESGRRFYTDAHQKILLEAEKIKKEAVGYTLINLRDYGSLKIQKRAIERYCFSRGLEITAWFDDIGSSLNNKRSCFLELMDLVGNGKINKIIVANQSCLMRLDFELIELFCTKHGVEIVDLHLQLPSDKDDLERDYEKVRAYFLNELQQKNTHSKKYKTF